MQASFRLQFELALHNVFYVILGKEFGEARICFWRGKGCISCCCWTPISYVVFFRCLPDVESRYTVRKTVKLWIQPGKDNAKVCLHFVPLDVESNRSGFFHDAILAPNPNLISSRRFFIAIADICSDENVVHYTSVKSKKLLEAPLLPNFLRLSMLPTMPVLWNCHRMTYVNASYLSRFSLT